MRHAKVVEVHSEFAPQPYLQLLLPDGTRAAVPAGLDVRPGDALVVVSEYGTPSAGRHEPTQFPALLPRRTRKQK